MITDLIGALTKQGFAIDGRPSKSVSDALRWEMRRRRVRRFRRGLHRPGSMPRSTEYRMDQRVQSLRGGHNGVSQVLWDN